MANAALPRIVAFAIATATGAAAWFLLGAATGKHEAWDSPLYLAVVLPILALASGVLGYMAPGCAVSISLGMAAGQFVALLVQTGLGSLFPQFPGIRDSFLWPYLKQAWPYGVLALTFSYAG